MSMIETTELKGAALPPQPPIQRFFGSAVVSVLIYFAIIGVIIWGSFTGAQNMGYNWQWYRVPQYLYSFTDDGFQLGELLIGLIATIQLSFTAFVLATLLGLLVALLRLSGLVVGSAVAVVFLALAGAFGAFVALKMVLADELWLFTFGLTLWFCVPLVIPMMLRRNSTAGQSKVMWCAFIGMAISYWCAIPTTCMWSRATVAERSPPSTHAG